MNLVSLLISLVIVALLLTLGLKVAQSSGAGATPKLPNPSQLIGDAKSGLGSHVDGMSSVGSETDSVVIPPTPPATASHSSFSTPPVVPTRVVYVYVQSPTIVQSIPTAQGHQIGGAQLSFAGLPQVRPPYLGTPLSSP